MTETRTDAELAAQALQGYQDAEELILQRDAEARRLNVAYNQLSSARHQGRLDGGMNWMDALDADDPDVGAAFDAYRARLREIAGATER